MKHDGKYAAIKVRGYFEALTDCPVAFTTKRIEWVDGGFDVVCGVCSNVSSGEYLARVVGGVITSVEKVGGAAVADDSGVDRLRRENEKLAVDSVVLDKIMRLIEEDAECEIRTAHDAFELIHDIRTIIEERGDEKRADEKIVGDSVVLDKIVGVIDGFRDRKADTFIQLYSDLKAIREIIDGRGD